jgi:AcrR family transcriptional regulator
MEQEQRRQHIIDSTIRVLARDGLTGASLSRVAAEAGAAKGILCYYFTNKDGLFDAVLGYVQNSMLNAALRNADQGADCWQQVSNFIVAHLDYVNDNRDEVLAIRNLGSTRAGGSDVSDHLSIWTNQRDWLIAALSSGQSLGEFKDFDAGIASTAILGAMESALIQWAHEHDGGAPRSLLRSQRAQGEIARPHMEKAASQVAGSPWNERKFDVGVEDNGGASRI